MRAVAQVVLFMDPRNSNDLGRAVRAAFEEMESFYNLDKPRFAYTRDYISEYIPDGLRNADAEAVLSRFASARAMVEPDRPRARGMAPPRVRTVAYSQVLELVRQVLPGRRGSKYLVVTDLELTPPKEWRYVVFDGDASGAVISKAPTDPRYWAESDEGRVQAVKHRVRTAGLNILGRTLGLESCGTEGCFMFENIDSVTRLDSMVKLCTQHQMPALEGRGFATATSDPEEVQPIVLDPAPAGAS